MPITGVAATSRASASAKDRSVTIPVYITCRSLHHETYSRLGRAANQQTGRDHSMSAPFMRSVLLAMIVVVFFQASTIGAQNPTATIHVQVRASDKPVEGAEVIVAGTAHRTDASGRTTVST